MAGTQTAEQKAAADKAVAEKQAADEKAKQDAAAKAAAESKAKADAEQKAAESGAAKASTTKAPGLVVLGPVAVIPLVSGGERYVYRGAPVGDEFTKEGVKHAQSVGLVGKPKK